MKIINDSAAGSATDVATRLMAERLSQVWGQQAIVDNRPGAGGSIAVRAASEAAPDGYTLYVGAASTFTALKGAPGVAPNLPIELPRDFTPIGFITQQPMFMAVSPQLGIKSLPELIELAKKKPGELSYATTGRGRITHLTMEMVQLRAGIKLQMIPYTGGPHASMADLATGRVAHRHRRLFGPGRRPDQRHDQGHRGFVARAAGRFQGSADRGRDAAGLCRRRLERAARADRHAGSDRPEGQRRPEQGARRRDAEDQVRRRSAPTCVR